jgi:hypothetical protein
MRAGVFSGDSLGTDEAMLEAVRASPAMTGRSLAELVSTPEVYRLPAIGDSIGTLAVLDLGVKASTLRYLQQQGFDLVVLPHVLEFAERPHQILREAERVRQAVAVREPRGERAGEGVPVDLKNSIQKLDQRSSQVREELQQESKC